MAWVLQAFLFSAGQWEATQAAIAEGSRLARHAFDKPGFSPDWIDGAPHRLLSGSGDGVRFGVQQGATTVGSWPGRQAELQKPLSGNTPTENHRPESGIA